MEHICDQLYNRLPELFASPELLGVGRRQCLEQGTKQGEGGGRGAQQWVAGGAAVTGRLQSCCRL